KQNITIGERILDGDYLESPNKTFQMGFFSGESGRYVGIWYAIDHTTVVWVASRDKPVPDSTGALIVAEEGVRILDRKGNIHFSADAGGASNKTLALLDDGNVVLIDNNNTVIWQSFDNPTDTFLRGMKMNMSSKLISWKSPNDPSTGSFVFQQEKTMQYVIRVGNTTRWKSGSGSKKYKLELNHMFPADARFLMSDTGNIQYFTLVELNKPWSLVWEEPKDICSDYQVCGQYGLCSPDTQTRCSCLKGFEATEPGVDSAGCRHEPKICGTGEVDEFLNFSMIEVSNPTSSESTIESNCRNKCLENCRCKAYSFSSGNTGMQQGHSSHLNNCRIWESELYNLQMDGTDNISIRIARGVGGYINSAQGYPSPTPRGDSSPFLSKTRILVFTSTILMILLLCSFSYTYYRRLVPHEQGRNSTLQTDDSERRSIDLVHLEHSREDSIEGIRVPFFEFESILAATDNFSDANKLGEGGFGPVYKGKLPEGIQVAVKRLSSLSGQ
ncbi:G-type lectin S-receptor-like serine/threonine-protein kinase At4g03230, partial [Cynara cardunculus var. scolymus]|uniref:G-type lectin S-receptor-like serine/threonine-protein kinase At4g03230 n=1 Tax=Cynara cardunculus var. scolymus TaxID=59895 RepID=UPI000D628176